MRVMENGVMRDATQEEIALWEQESQGIPSTLPTDSERLDALENAIRKGLSL